jgi:hypothetical protein
VRIESFQVVNYKSFADSKDMHLKPGFNMIVGRNNVDKTALAEALGLRFADKPHLSTKTVPRPGAAPANAASQAEVLGRLGAEELAELLATEMPAFNAPTSSDRPGAGEAPVQAMLSDGVTVRVVYRNGGVLSSQLSVYDRPQPI